MTKAGWHELTPRERAVLAAVERRLSNAEIAAEFHISARTVESHIASLRRKLDADSRAKLISAAHTGRGTSVQVPQNSFVGRAGDLQTVRALLERERWVTVVGAAGSGKTRLALELAGSAARVPVVVELEHATADDVVGVVARAIGLGTDSTADLVAACGVALAAQPYMLVVDNCDRVSVAVVQIIGELLAVAGSLTVLATSRSPIGGSDETVYQLAPLPVDESPDSGAVRLFLDRASSAAPATGSLSESDQRLVTRICRRLDGLPLAIELAAARVRHLPLLELAIRLDDGFGPLDRAGPSTRHRTLEAAFGWTWDLLDDEERSVLSALAALPGTFDLELAEAVTAPGAGSVVLRLLDRSLVSPTVATSERGRFRLLGSLRAFVLDRTESGIVHEVRRGHAVVHANLAAAMSARARTDDSRAAAEETKRLSGEMNAALDWAITQQPELALPLARSIAVLLEQYGPDIESLETVARAARDPHVRQVSNATELLEVGLALCYGDLDVAAELASFALGLAEDERSELAARHLAGTVDAYRHRGRAALIHLEAAERLAVEYADLWQLASVRQGMGIAYRGQELDDQDAAIAAFESAMNTYALAGDAMHVNNARYMMAAAAADAGRQTPEAILWAEQCVAYARGSGNRHELAHAVLTRARLSPGPDSDADLFEAVDTFRAVGDLRCLTRSFLRLAASAAALEQVALLHDALDVAGRAHDVGHQTITMEWLIRVHWESGEHRGAGIILGALIDLIGYLPSTSRCPAAMIDELHNLRTAIAEG